MNFNLKWWKNNLLALLYYLKSDLLQLLFAALFIILVGVIALVFKRDDLGFQAFRAFDSADESLNYIHRPSIVSGSCNILLTTIYAVVLCLIGNSWASIGNSKRKIKSRDASKTPNIEIKQKSKLNHIRDLITPEQQVRMYRVVWGLLYLFVAIVETNLVTNFAKTTMGVLKPHFLRECKPDQEILNKLLPETWVDENLTETICTNHEVDYRRSFPSGHASQAAVGVAYAFLEVNNLPNFLLARVLQIVGVVYSVYIYTLRITNNQHNWYDVLAGAILGTLVAISAYIMKEKQVQRQFRVGTYLPISDSSDCEGPKERQRVVTDRETNVDEIPCEEKRI